MPAIPALTLWHPGTPRAKGRPRTETIQRMVGGRLVSKTKTVTPKATKREEESIGYEWRMRHSGNPLEGDISMTVVMVGGEADADNHVKLLADSLQAGVAFWNDKQVVHLRVWKLPNDCGAPVGTWISVRPLPKGWAARVARWLARVLC